MVWESATPTLASGNTVTTPPTGRSPTATGPPSSVTNLEPRLHAVRNSDRPGPGPSERTRKGRRPHRWPGRSSADPGPAGSFGPLPDPSDERDGQQEGSAPRREALGHRPQVAQRLAPAIPGMLQIQDVANHRVQLVLIE